MKLTRANIPAPTPTPATQLFCLSRIWKIAPLGLLLREVEAKFGFIAQFARCFTDHRDPESIEHNVGQVSTIEAS